MIPLVVSNVLLVSFPWRNLAFSSSPTHFTLDFNFAPISQTKLFSTIDVAKEVEKDDSFTVSYLINSCGLSSESAKLASKNLRLKDSLNPDSVLDCFRNYGFSDAHIKRVVRGKPQVLRTNVEKTLKPKMDFFLSIGVNGKDLVTIICGNPRLLFYSLNKKIIPRYYFLKRVLVHDELVRTSLKRSYVWISNLEKNALPNFELLKKLGVPESRIEYILTRGSPSLGMDNANFSKMVNKIISMGFDPSKFSFTEAIIYWPMKSTWERKSQVCRSLGWSDSDIWSAFRNEPHFMQRSVEKITAVMDFMVNKMGWDPSSVAAASNLFGYSLEKNTIPKCSVIRVLQLKGLIGEEIPMNSIIQYPENKFLDMYVFKYLKQVPELLDIYEGEVDPSELGCGFEEKLDSMLK